MKQIAHNYSSNKPMTNEEIEQRVLQVVKAYDKIAVDKVFIFSTLLIYNFVFLCFFSGVFCVCICVCSRVSLSFVKNETKKCIESNANRKFVAGSQTQTHPIRM